MRSNQKNRPKRAMVPSRGWLYPVALLSACQAPTQPVVTVAAPSVPVETAQVKPGELDESWTIAGFARAASYATVAAQSSGEIRRMEVQEGQIVDQGAVMLAVDDALIKAQMDRAKLEMDISAAAADGRSPILKARVEELSVELVRHEVRAPFKGLVAARYVDLGDWVFVGEPVVDLVSLGEVEVIVDGPPELIGDVQPGATASLVGRTTVLGEVMTVIPVIDPKSQTVRMRIKPTEPRDWLVHGANVGVQVPLTRSADGVVVPKTALIRSERGLEVVRMTGDRAIRVAVVQLAWTDEDALVRGQDLREGDTVVTRGADRLHTGQLLQPVASLDAPTTP